MTERVSIVKRFVTIIAVMAGLFHLYSGGISALSSMDQRGMHWLFMSVLALLTYPATKKNNGTKWYDYLFVLAAIAASLYVLITWPDRINRFGPSTDFIKNMDLLMGILMVFIVLETTRRTTGLFLALTAAAFLAYMFFGPYLPGIFMHRGYDLERVVPYLLFTTEGIYGIALGVCSSFIILFILFGSFLHQSGAGQFFIDLAFSLAGRLRGGPAKTAIISSGLMGSISGSPIANVVTTGTFTIPLMIRAGYNPNVACAVEAVASTGGMIMPPMMGAAAFIMAEFLSVPYKEVIIAAFLPALLYYIAIYLVVDLEAAKQGIVGLPAKDLPSFKDTLRTGGHLLIPLIGLVYFLIQGYSPQKTVFWSIITVVVVSFLKKESRINLNKFFIALEKGITQAVPVATACAAAGIIVAAVNLTGLGVRFSTQIVELSRGIPLIALFMTMVASLILGMGLPATAVYVVVASVAAPALIKMGFSPMASHLFVFYFGIISTITPPVALTAYAAAGLVDKANPNKVGIKAFLFGLIAFVMPYVFMWEPSFLFADSMFNIIVNMGFALFGLYFFAGGIVGFFGYRLNKISRLFIFMIGFFSIYPSYMVNIAAFITGIVVIVFGKKSGFKNFIGA